MVGGYVWWGHTWWRVYVVGHAWWWGACVEGGIWNRKKACMAVDVCGGGMLAKCEFNADWFKYKQVVYYISGMWKLFLSTAILIYANEDKLNKVLECRT